MTQKKVNELPSKRIKIDSGHGNTEEKAVVLSGRRVPCRSSEEKCIKQREETKCCNQTISQNIPYTQSDAYSI